MAELDQLARRAVAAPPTNPPAMADLRTRASAIRRARRVRQGGALVVLVALVALLGVLVVDGDDDTSVEVLGPTVTDGDAGPVVRVADAAGRLALELRREMVLTAAQSGDDDVSGLVVEQRARTDGAVDAYRRAVGALGARDEALRGVLEQAETRLGALPIVRQAADQRDVAPDDVLRQQDATLTTVTEVLGELVDETDEADEVRDLLVYAQLAQALDAAAEQQALLSLVVAQGGYVRWVGPMTVEPCGADLAACRLYQDVVAAGDAAVATTSAFQDLASPTQRQALRDAEAAGDVEAMTAALIDAGPTGRPVGEVVTLDAWRTQVLARLDAQDRVARQVLATIGAPEPGGVSTSAPPASTEATVVDPGGAGDVALGVDPNPGLDETTTELHLWIAELACAGGATPAAERLVGPEVVETEDAVTITAHVTPPPARADGKFSTCPGLPPIEVTVELDAPLGSRQLLDGTTTPPSPMTVRPSGW